MSDNDLLGNRMKEYESHETDRRFISGLPLYARIDGRGFSKFTKNMVRPYDTRLSDCMVSATKVLVERTHATIGYTQSDEISLVWTDPNWFDGKVMKMASVLAGLTTASFINGIQYKWVDPDMCDLISALPHFDARVIALPSLMEASNMLLWRNLDATKNAISMAASHYYSHSQLHGKNGSEKQEMLFKKGINFNDYPYFFKRGTWIKREVVDVTLSPDQLNKIPEKHRPDPNQTVKRTYVTSFDLPPLNKIKNRVDVLFKGAAPENID